MTKSITCLPYCSQEIAALTMTSRILFILSCGLLLTACSDECDPTASNHPRETCAPHTNSPATHIKLKNSQLETNHNIIGLMGRYIKKNNLKGDSIGVISKPGKFRIEHVKNDRFIFLKNTPKIRLVEYKVGTGKHVLAEEGKGPEKLYFASDISVRGDTLKVSSKARKIHIYSCKTYPCEYIDVTNTQEAILSIAQTKSKTLTLTGVDANEKEEYIAPAIQSPYNNNISFGDTYKSKSFLVINHYRKGQIEYLENTNILSRSSDKLPYVWTYVNEELKERYIVSNFKALKTKYDSDERSITHNYENKWNEIQYIEPWLERYLIIKVGTEFVRRPRRDTPPIHSFKDKYFIIDTKTKKYEILGVDKYKSRYRRFLYLKGDDIFLIERGTLFLTHSTTGD